MHINTFLVDFIVDSLLANKHHKKNLDLEIIFSKSFLFFNLLSKNILDVLYF